MISHAQKASRHIDKRTELFFLSDLSQESRYSFIPANSIRIKKSNLLWIFHRPDSKFWKKEKIWIKVRFNSQQITSHLSNLIYGVIFQEKIMLNTFIKMHHKNKNLMVQESTKQFVGARRKKPILKISLLRSLIKTVDSFPKFNSQNLKIFRFP